MSRLRLPVALYIASRLLFLAIAVVDAAVHHHGLGDELHHWDGHWYLAVAASGYPHTVQTAYEHYSTLGFLPGYPLLIWGLSQLTGLTLFGSGLTLSLVFGLCATVLVSELARQWWGDQAARRATVFWCLWPGTIVFSMVYSEGLSITLLAASLLALSQRRWLIAGVCAGCATAVAPIAVAIVPAFIYAAYREVQAYRARSADSRAGAAGTRFPWRPVVAACLSPMGLIGFGIFLWSWCGSPFASVAVQRGAWGNSSTPLAVPERVISTIGQIFGIGHPAHGPGGIDLYNIAAAICTALLIYALVLLWRQRHQLPAAALIYTGFAALLMLTSNNAPPDPRMLINAFPAVLVVGAHTTGRRRIYLLAGTIFLTFVLSWFTFVGDWMLP
jgi:Mannosyltransferase (PIG-V)